ncbi:adenylate/guanylate cyclase domain-containing protein [Rhodospira trueperi]|uniref:Adenylate cyclase, class 3 n=1 Tax=Rhodospira trueperi TaxID=69960 RepID=A0A1G7A874_9PROT|nr:adenylate/guanylate cyclase domain-containing protein [Rhodospira trueperi]SDE11029.1 Adenylate cyclase, class 3 [Rhodospira trueperi]
MGMRARIVWALRLIAIVLGAAWISLLAQRHVPVLAMTENWLADFRIATLLPAEPQHQDIVLVTVTEQTLERFTYRSPIDRGFLADLLETLDARGVETILLDFLLDQPTEPDKDARLRAVLRNIETPLVVCVGDRPEGLTAPQVAFLEDMVPPRVRGLATLAKDPFDATVRWIYPGRADDAGGWRAGAVWRLAELLGHPMMRESRRIAWHGRPDKETPAFATYPAHLVEHLPPDWMRDKIVLIGTDLLLTDRHRTPFSTAPDGESMPGVAILAHALATVLDDRTMDVRSGDGLFRFVLWTALLGGLLALLPIPLVPQMGIAGGVVVAGWVGAFALYRQTGIMVPLLVPTLAFALATWGSHAALVQSERKHRAFLRRAFTQYVAPQVVRQIVADPSQLAVRGERREMSFLFADVANFTTLSETMAPEALTRLINEYLEVVCQVIYRHEGTICTFMGDGVFALFSAPIVQPDHRHRAVACAFDMAEAAEAFRQARVNEGLAFGHTRIGIHAGAAVVGNIGASMRFQYTAVGDAVNTASRLEGLNKYFGTRVCVSADALPPDMRSRTRPMGQIVLRGRSQPLPVFEILTAEAAQTEMIEQYRRAYAMLEQGDTEAAERAFLALQEIAPEDGCTAFFVRRLQNGQTGTVVMMTQK